VDASFQRRAEVRLDRVRMSEVHHDRRPGILQRHGELAGADDVSPGAVIDGSTGVSGIDGCNDPHSPGRRECLYDLAAHTAGGSAHQYVDHRMPSPSGV
jgi:hypothetical protein